MNRDVFRILDANLNRCREALRVIEDYARFVLDDADAARSAKNARHELRSLDVDADERLRARDIEQDVGRDEKTESEMRRGQADDVVRAAFARVTEAARSIGEYAKIVSIDTAVAAERLRYAAYQLEQRIILRGPLRARFRAVRLYVLITESISSGPWLETAAAALRGGARCIQLREKQLDDRELLDRAKKLRALCDEENALFILNDRPDIARLCRADGVHVGQDDLDVRQVRRIGGNDLLVGVSTHAPGQIDAALSVDPDYVAVGPMFDSATKPADRIAGVGLLVAAVERTDLPIVPIGGIDASNVAGLVTRGAGAVCVCSAVIADRDPEAAARRLCDRISAAETASR